MLVLDLTLQPWGASAEPAPAVKDCTKCGEAKALEHFSPNKIGRLGRKSQCRICKRPADRQYRADNAEARRVYFRQYDQQRNQTPERQVQLRAKDQRYRARKCQAEVETFTPEDLYAAWDDADYAGCYWCDGDFTEADPLHVDHLVPLARDGAHAVWNLVPAHMTCNTSKGAKDPYAYALERYPWLAS